MLKSAVNQLHEIPHVHADEPNALDLGNLKGSRFRENVPVLLKVANAAGVPPQRES